MDSLLKLFINSINVNQLNNLFEASEISLKTEKASTIIRRKIIEDGVEVQFSYRSGENYFTAKVLIIIEDDEIHLEF